MNASRAFASLSVTGLLDGYRATINLRALEVPRGNLEVPRGNLEVPRGNLEIRPTIRPVGAQAWSSSIIIDSLELHMTSDGSALVDVIDRSIQAGVRGALEHTLIDRLLFDFPFALFAIDHADGKPIREIAPAMRELWAASPEQHESRRAFIRTLADWAREARR